MAVQPRPKQHAYKQGNKYHNAAHGRRAVFAEVRRRPVGTLVLLYFVRRKSSDYRRAYEQGYNKRGKNRASGAECYVAEYIKKTYIVFEK
ncbi:hypothetical protein FACS189437_03100 [Bacteroidia bacterium]|nr:hypothetical protein FACS189437_03100 [Bacteroidia bacterium]